MKKFPKNFYWGTATSAYQVEGGIKNDWSAVGGKYNAGRACDHYNRFESDFDLAQKMNNNAHRFSIEWARIEPEQGKFDQKEIEHYKKVIKALKDRGLEPFVTLYHWTLPVWFAKKGGWLNKKSPEYFAKYVEFVVRNLPDVKFWVVLNEPIVGLGHKYIDGEFPPFKKLAIIKFIRSIYSLVRAYKGSYKVIHKINPRAKVSISQMMSTFEAKRSWCPAERLFAFVANFLSGDYFYNLIKNYIDYTGFSYYHYYQIVWYPPFSKKSKKRKTDMNWPIYPEGIYHILKHLKKYNKPIYITENGLADADDSRRADFIRDHLKWVHKAIKEGIDVRGYFHWSLLDNYEWARQGGFVPRYGLIEIDYKTFERTSRPSSKVFAEICKNNAIDV